MGPETFPDFLFEFGKPKLRRQIQMREKPGFPAHSHVSWEVSPKAGMAGWRCSDVPTGLQSFSLQTGNFSGNLRNFCPKSRRRPQEKPVPQRLPAEFPTTAIREKRCGRCPRPSGGSMYRLASPSSSAPSHQPPAPMERSLALCHSIPVLQAQP